MKHIKTSYPHSDLQKQNGALLCLICVLLTAMVSCSQTNTKEDTVSDQTEAATETAALYTDNLPERDFGKIKLNIMNSSPAQVNYDTEATGDVIEDAIYARNKSVEERFNIDLNYITYGAFGADMESVRTALVGSVMGGTMDFDLVIGGSGYIPARIFDNLFTDLNTLDHLDLSQPWWYQFINQNLEICGRQYLVSGASDLQAIGGALVTYFNKTLVEQHDLGNMYELVNSGAWTIDKMIEMAKTISQDLDGDGKWTSNDLFGITTPNDYWSCMTVSFDHEHVTRTEDSIVLTGASEKMVDINDKLYEIFYADYCADPQNTDIRGEADRITGMVSLFANDKALFMTHRLDDVRFADMRNMENYGILPCCKFDEGQETYYAFSCCDALGIPSLVRDTEMSAIILEALNSMSYDTVVPAFYDIALQRKFTRDEDSSAMLDIIRGSLRSDFVYMFGSLVGYDLMYTSGHTENYTSWMKKNEAKIQAGIDKTLETLRQMEH